MSVKLNKNSFRKQAKIKILNKAKNKARCVNYPLLNNIFNLIKASKAKNILLYIPMSYEVDILKLRPKLRNYNLFVPLMVNKSLKMVKLRLPFIPKKYGVKEARNSLLYFNKIDLAIVPVIGVDANLARIGHGMGFYDRFFDSLSYKPKIIFVQIENLFTNANICDYHDIKADFYINPTKLYIRSKNDRNYLSTHCRVNGRSYNRLFRS